MSKALEGDTSLKENVLLACRSGDLKTLAQLLASYDIASFNPPIQPGEKYGPQPILPTELPKVVEFFVEAVKGKQPEILSFLFEIFPSYTIGDTILRPAVFDPDISTFEILRRHDEGLTNFEFQTLQTPLIYACQNEDDDFAAYLLDKGADPNLGGLGPFSALYYAVQKKSINVVKKLVECGAEIDDRFALSEAVSLGQFDMIKVFLDKWSEVATAEMPLEAGTLLEFAVKCGKEDIVKLLLEHGAEMGREESA